MADELKTIKFQMMLAPSEAEALDDWGFSHRIRSRAEAIRRLIRNGLLYEETYKYSILGNKLVHTLLSGQMPPIEDIVEYVEQGERHIDGLKANSELIKRSMAESMAERMAAEDAEITYEQALQLALRVLDEESAKRDSPQLGRSGEEQKKRKEYINEMREALQRRQAKKP